MIGFADFEAFLKASFPDMTDGMVERFRLMDAGYRDSVSYTHLTLPTIRLV